MTDMTPPLAGTGDDMAPLHPHRFRVEGPAPAKAAPDSPVYARAALPFDDAFYAQPAAPLYLGARAVEVPPGADNLCTIRLPIKRAGSEEFVLPPHLGFLKPLIEECAAYQKAHFPDFAGRHADLIFRSGLKGSVNQQAGEFHANDVEDIYLSKPLPHQSYFWASSHPVLYADQAYPRIPPGTKRDDLAEYFNGLTDRNAVKAMTPRGLHVIDNYHVHAKPPVPEGLKRTFIRVCFAPYATPGGAPNPWLPDNEPS